MKKRTEPTEQDLLDLARLAPDDPLKRIIAAVYRQPNQYVDSSGVVWTLEPGVIVVRGGRS